MAVGASAGHPSATARWLSGRALLLHVALLIWFPGCLVAMWWQVTVALGGNSLGWLYAIEWPVFAVLGVFGWWQLIHDDEETIKARKWRGRGVAPPAAGATPTAATPTAAAAAASVEEPEPAFDARAIRSIHRAEEEDEQLAAYNAYLARLAGKGTAKTWRNPTGADR